MKRFSIILLLALCGCTSQPSRAEAEAARKIVMQRLGSGANIAGPVSKEGKKELELLSQEDRSVALLDRGSLGFLVFAPDYNTVFHTKDGIIADSIKVERIVFVLNSEIVGDFLVQKKEPNQSLQRNASAGSVSNFESPARRG